MPIIIKKRAAATAPAPEPLAPRRAVQPGKTCDGICRHVLRQNPNCAIPWWLIASYTYYHHDMPLLSDGLYDEMAKAMLKAWDELKHPHKHLISRSHLEAGSLFDLPASAYPNIVKYAAANLARGELGVSIIVQ